MYILYQRFTEKSNFLQKKIFSRRLRNRTPYYHSEWNRTISAPTASPIWRARLDSNQWNSYGVRSLSRGVDSANLSHAPIVCIILEESTKPTVAHIIFILGSQHPYHVIVGAVALDSWPSNPVWRRTEVSIPIPSLVPTVFKTVL